MEPAVQRNVADIHQRDPLDVVKLGIGGDIFRIKRNDGELDPLLFAGLDHIAGKAKLLCRKGHHHFVRGAALQHFFQRHHTAQIGQSGDGVVLRKIAVNHVSVCLLTLDHLDIADGHVAVPHQKDMFLVKAPLTVVPQQIAENDPLCGHTQKASVKKVTKVKREKWTTLY